MRWTNLYALLIFTVSCLLCFFPRPLAAPWRIPSYRGESLRGKSNFTSGAWSPRCSLWLASCSQQSHLISPLNFRLPSQVPIHSRAHLILAPRQIILGEMTGGSYHASSGWHAVDMCPSDVPRLIAIATVTLRRDELVSSLLVLLASSKYGVKPRKNAARKSMAARDSGRDVSSPPSAAGRSEIQTFASASPR